MVVSVWNSTIHQNVLSIKSLIYTTQTSTQFQPFKCEVCNYSTTTKGNLSIHMQSDKHLYNIKSIQHQRQQQDKKNANGNAQPNSKEAGSSPLTQVQIQNLRQQQVLPVSVSIKPHAWCVLNFFSPYYCFRLQSISLPNLLKLSEVWKIRLKGQALHQTGIVVNYGAAMCVIMRPIYHGIYEYICKAKSTHII